MSDNEENDFQIDAELAAILAKMKAKVNEGNMAGQVVRLKEGTHFIKLVVPPGRDWNDFFEPYTTEYEGKKQKNFLVNGVIAKSTQEGLEDRSKIRHIRATKTMLEDIFAQIGGGAKLFADKAQVLQVRIYKDGQYTKYQVIAQQQVLNSAKSEYPESTIEEAAKGQEEFSAKSAADKDSLPLPFATASASPDSDW